MPASGDKLTVDQIATLAKWIDEGIQWESAQRKAQTTTLHVSHCEHSKQKRLAKEKFLLKDKSNP